MVNFKNFVCRTVDFLYVDAHNNSMKYIERIFDGVLESTLKSKGAVIIEGPKWCGKTTTAKRHCASVVDLLPTNTRASYIALAKSSPADFLSLGDAPMLIDEWQHVSFLFDDIKSEVDKRGFGQFILTGSVTDKSVEKEKDDEEYARHTGNGRIVRRRMRTMSLFESGESNGKVSLSSLRNGSFSPCQCSFSLKDYATAICRGGWPLSLYPCEDPLSQAHDYFDVLCTDDLFSLKNVPLIRDEEKARLFLRSYARAISSAVGEDTMRKDCLSYSESFSRETFEKYMLALRYLCIVDDVPAWNPNLRSQTAIRAKPKRHLTDPSIAASALGLTPEGLFYDMSTFGLLFESLCVRDIHVYASAIGARVYHYQDSKRREADITVTFRDGCFALFECKLGGDDDIDDAATKLRAIQSDIDESKTGKCAFCAVLTKGNLAYRRQDGVYVLPLAVLRP